MGNGNIIQIADLHFLGGGSDKVYHAALRQASGGYTVEFAYGRRYSTLNYGSKTTSPVTLEKAQNIFEKLISEKTSKGYVSSPGVSGVVFEGASSAGSSVVEAAMKTAQAKESTGILPQLLNPIDDDEAGRLIKDPAWGAQEKKDGKRMLLKSDGKGNSFAINRKGFKVQMSPAVSADLQKLGRRILLDGESIGNKVHIFEMLELDGKDIRSLPYSERFRMVADTLKEHTGNGLEIVPLAVTSKDKASLYNKLKAGEKEGIVFKLLSAPYSPNRPNSGGDQLKKKFIETASVVVLDVNDKRSIKMGVYMNQGDTEPTFVGNCTIPPNKGIPKKGDVVEVEYLYAYRGGSLFQPVYIMKRDDIDAPDGCAADQLKYCENGTDGSSNSIAVSR